MGTTKSWQFLYLLEPDQFLKKLQGVLLCKTSVIFHFSVKQYNFVAQNELTACFYIF